MEINSKEGVMSKLELEGCLSGAKEEEQIWKIHKFFPALITKSLALACFPATLSAS